MCGRYFLRLTPQKLKEIFGTGNIVDFSSILNATPMQMLPILVQRRMGMARWGLLPSHASHDDKTLCAKLKNARSETLQEKKSFAELWQRGRRCLIPASGFYEWPEEKIKGHPPYEITHENEAIAFAGLWNKHEDLITFTILTCAATEDLQKIHSRMPVMFAPSQCEEWMSADSVRAYEMLGRDNLKSGFNIELLEKSISQNEQLALV